MCVCAAFLEADVCAAFLEPDVCAAFLEADICRIRQKSFREAIAFNEFVRHKIASRNPAHFAHCFEKRRTAQHTPTISPCNVLIRSAKLECIEAHTHAQTENIHSLTDVLTLTRAHHSLTCTQTHTHSLTHTNTHLLTHLHTITHTHTNTHTQTHKLTHTHKIETQI